MLKKYEVSNFKSFKNATVFELEKTNYKMLSNTNIRGDMLKGIMFVGANASGKSNAIMALKFLLDCLFGKNDVNIASYICMFSENPLMSVKYTFDVEGTEIIYEVSYQRIDKSIKETLLIDGKQAYWRDGSVAMVCFAEEIFHTDIPSNTLFLRDIYFNTKFRGNKSLQKWFEFLSNSVYVDLHSTTIVSYKDIDLSLKTYIEERGPSEINQFFEEYNFEQKIEYANIAKGHVIQVESPEKMIFFKRKELDEPIPYVFESLGNKTLLHILPAFFHCIKHNGILILDEFSSGFHNDLEELLVRYFMKKADLSQLIFVTHSTNLLSNSILRPDQIYAVDFGKEGSCIKRFSSEKPREAQNVEKMYLSGVFSGVPKYEHTIK